ncbi:MAG: hypothetical protein KDK05_02005 [Candidatus Competibacteraceae bacterium]|nr:hypothetical protein [Candidatus Competibacteraceae bacterium]
MTRHDLLKYIESMHGDALAQVGLLAVDSQESLFYVIDDALRQSNDQKRKAEADKRTAQLIYDRAQMLELELEVADPQPVDSED